MDIYVDVRAGRDGNGSKEMPFRRINEAAKVAKPGDTVLVAPGVYREYVLSLIHIQMCIRDSFRMVMVVWDD